jgi:uncharacterized protein YxjI
MRLYMKQKVFSFRDRFTVKDETGADRYFAEGELFSWGKKLHVYEALSGHEAAFLKQRVFSFLPRFEIYVGERLVTEVVKKFTPFRQSYAFSGLDWRLEGDFWAHDYTVVSGGQTIVTVRKAWFSWGDSYELALAPGVNEPLVLAAVLAVDCVLDAAQSHGD